MARQTIRVASSRTQIEFSNGTTLRVAPFVGQATQWVNERGSSVYRMPAEEDSGPAWRLALEENGIVEQETIQVDVTGAATRRGYTARPANDLLILRPGPPPRGAEQVVFYQDESGGVSWHFPDDHADAPRRGTRARSRSLPAVPRTFSIPARTIESQRAFTRDRVTTRGLLTKWGRKILKVLVIPALSPIVGNTLEAVVGAIERRCRQDLIRAVTPDDYLAKAATEFADWDRLAGGRALLVLHGIFSSTDGMLAQLPRAEMERLHAHYGGRIIAFDHLTVSADPEANARLLLERLAAASAGHAARRFQFDVLCHSRGGIVARTLAERGKLLVPAAPCSFENVFFAGTPNQGSPLADPRHMVEMIDVFTNLLTNFPDGPALFAIEVFLAIVKLMAHAFGTSLPGVAAMGTEGFVARVLNHARPGAPASTARYAAAASNYEPDPSRDNAFFTGRFADWIMDRVFTANGRPMGNDLVVPSEGVFAANGAAAFPIADPLVFAPSDHVWHCGFFSQRRALDRIHQHFGIDTAAVTLAAARAPAGKAEGGGPEPQPDALALPPEEPGALLDAIPAAPAAADEEGGMAAATGEEGGGAGDIAFVGGGFGFRGTRSRRTARAAPPSPVAAARPRTTRAAPVPAAPPAWAAQPMPAGLAPAPAAAVVTVEEPVPDTPVQRQPNIDFHEQVDEGVANDLVVRLADLLDQARGDTLKVAIPPEKESVTLDVIINAAGFDIEPAHAPITVRRTFDAHGERATFTLTAHSPGAEPARRAIHADFFLGNSCIGSVSHYTFVIPRNWTGARPSAGEQRNEAFSVAAVRREDADWVIHVMGDASPYQLFVRSSIPGDAYPLRPYGALNLPGGQLSDLFDTVLRQQFDSYPSPRGMTEAAFKKAARQWQERFAQQIEAFGRQLWTYLPQALRDAYFRLYDRRSAPASIQIHSTDMTFPWELVIPFRGDHPGERLLPLGIAHIIGRWKPSLSIKPPSQILQVKRFCVVNPQYPEPDTLPYAAVEAAELRKLFPGLTLVTPADWKSFNSEVLDREDVQLLHFTGHGTFAKPSAELSELVLEDVPLNALSMTGTPLCLQAQPVVYLNACSVGAVGVSVGRPAGFAAALLDGDGQQGGCTGVIAPYWPVNDERAKDFSISLYKKLKMRRTIGEALQELRAEHASDPTYSAYAYFGDAWMRCNFAV